MSRGRVVGRHTWTHITRDLTLFLFIVTIRYFIHYIQLLFTFKMTNNTYITIFITINNLPSSINSDAKDIIHRVRKKMTISKIMSKVPLHMTQFNTLYPMP